MNESTKMLHAQTNFKNFKKMAHLKEEERLKNEQIIKDEKTLLKRERKFQEREQRRIKIAVSIENKDELCKLIFRNIGQLIFGCSSQNFANESQTVGFVELNLLMRNANLKVSKTTPAIKYIWHNIQICKCAEQIINHTDMMKMNQNLKDSAIDKSYRYEKLFEMYGKFYSRDVVGINTLTELSDAMIFVDNKAVFSNNGDYYLEFLRTVIPDVLYKEYSVKEVLLCLNNPQLREKAKSSIYAKGVNLSLYIALAKHIAKDYDIEQMLLLILDCFFIVEELNKLQSEYEIEQERQRLLNGDMSYEKDLLGKKLSLSNVKTGTDFEEYLSYIFSKLGYEVEPTKASGDMGVDLLLSKGVAKYVVQAKFYTGTVGFDAVKEAHTGKDIYKADKAVIVTNSNFTKQAIETAAKLNIILMDGDGLKRLVDSVTRGKSIDVFN